MSANAVFAAVLSFCTVYGAAALGLGVLNFIFGRRSQIDAWCNANPRAAAVLKLMRGSGTDPWQILQAVNLAVRGKLPDNIEAVVDVVVPPRPPIIPPPMLCLALALTALMFGACASGTAQMVPQVTKSCTGPLAKLDVAYAVDLIRVCPGLKIGSLNEADMHQLCPEYYDLEEKYAKLYDQAGAECAVESTPDAGVEAGAS